jgi:hypothetical protein
MNTNNKKFRKSTIVIPALALMVLTAGASATGAVAWFTATRQVTATASTFTAASTTAALSITATKGQGTEVVSNPSDANAGITLGASGSENYLCDASYDAANDKLYHSVLNDEGNVSSFAAIEDNAADSTTKTYDTGKKTNDGAHEIWYAVNWKFTFSYKTTNPAGSALFLDLKNTKFDKTDKVAPGFRIAFSQITGSSVSHYRVLANDTTNTYVNSSVSNSSSSYANYDASHITQDDVSTYSRKSDSTLSSSGLAALPEYLGTFTQGTSTTTKDSSGSTSTKTTVGVTSITLKCTAWFEGSDSAVINDNLEGNAALKATLSFYVRDLNMASD